MSSVDQPLSVLPAQSQASSPEARNPSPRKSRPGWFTHLGIAAYLAWLGHGLFCHALQYQPVAHPAMYFTVWDMFCGWSGWAHRNHVVAEGESGQFYRLTPTPWDEYQPYSNLGREHYDAFHNHLKRIGVNCINQTQHEPIIRMYVVEETWSKKFNLPDHLWGRVHDGPKLPQHYFRVNSVHAADGSTLERYLTFHDAHHLKWIAKSVGSQKSQRHSSGTVTQQSSTENATIRQLQRPTFLGN